MRTAFMAVLCAAAPAVAQCEEWLPAWGDSSLASCTSLAVADHDGAGPQSPTLYATTGGLRRWDSLAWWPIAGVTSQAAVLCTLSTAAGGFQAQTLLVGGSISTTLGPGRAIAAWDGTSFTAMGPTQVADFSTTAVVRAITPWDSDGPGPLEPWIVVTGNFTRFGGINAASIVAWNGTQWLTLGSGFAGEVSAATSYDPDGEGPLAPLLVVGLQGGTVRVWNGLAWSQLGVTFGARINALTMHDADGDGPQLPRLHACSAAGSQAWMRLGVWDGAAWVEAGTNTPTTGSSGTRSLVSLDLDGAGPNPPTLVACGSFGPAFPDGTFPTVALLANGTWTGVQGSPDRGITGAIATYAAALIDPDGPQGPRGVELIVGGSTERVGGPRGVSYAGMGAWNGQRFGTLGNEIAGGRVLRLMYHDVDGPGPTPPTVYAAGNFESAGGELAEGLARWDGARFVGMGTPTLTDDPPRQISRLTTHDPDGPGPQSPFLVAIDSTTTTTTRVVQWTGMAWATCGTGVSTFNYGTLSFDADANGPALPTIFRAGSFTASGLQRLTGSTWGTAGTPQPIVFYTFTANGDRGPDPTDPRMYVLGQNKLLRWLGSDWVQVGPSITWDNASRIPEMIWWDRDADGPAPPEVVVGVTSLHPYFTAIGHDGTAWRQVGDNLIVSPVKGLGTFDPDGDGPIPAQLMLGTGNTTSGGVRRLANGIWTPMGTGVQWLPPGDPSQEGVHAFLSFDPDSAGPTPPELWLAGGFSHAGGQPSRNFARWRFVTPPPAFVQFPQNVEACRGVPASIESTVVGAPSVAWQIFVQGTWVPLLDGPLVIQSNEVGEVQGATTAVLTVTWTGDPGVVTLRAILANTCGTTTGNSVLFTVSECATPCDGDVNCDFALDGFDVETQEKAVGGDTTDFCQSDPDFNGDFALDGFDVEAVEVVVGGGPCP